MDAATAADHWSRCRHRLRLQLPLPLSLIRFCSTRLQWICHDCTAFWIRDGGREVFKMPERSGSASNAGCRAAYNVMCWVCLWGSSRCCCATTACTQHSGWSIYWQSLCSRWGGSYALSGIWNTRIVYQRWGGGVWVLDSWVYETPSLREITLTSQCGNTSHSSGKLRITLRPTLLLFVTICKTSNIWYNRSCARVTAVGRYDPIYIFDIKNVEIEFCLYGQYKSDADATLSYMEDTLCHFHAFKDVFLLGRASKQWKAKANSLRTILVKMRKVAEGTNAENSMLSKKQHKINRWRKYISHEIDISKKLDADCNFPKIHLMSHWVKHVRWYRALQLYSAVRHEQAHKMNHKDCWNAYNHDLNFLLQVITFQYCIISFEIGGLNFQALAQHWEYSTAVCKVLHSGADVATPLSFQSYGKPE